MFYMLNSLESVKICVTRFLCLLCVSEIRFIFLPLVVQTLDSAFHRINHCPMDKY